MVTYPVGGAGPGRGLRQRPGDHLPGRGHGEEVEIRINAGRIRPIRAGQGIPGAQFIIAIITYSR